jgi:hypothetical protein
MDTLLHSFDASANALLAVLCGWAVLSHRINEGLVIKTGLIWMSVGFMAAAWALGDGLTCDDMTTLGRSQALVHAGMLCVAAGLALRVRGGMLARSRRASDWIKQPPERSP